jgi:hypothetical protein
VRSFTDITAEVTKRLKVNKAAPKLRELEDAFQIEYSTLNQTVIVVPPWVLEHEAIIRDPSALVILLAICAHANKAGMTAVGQERIAALTRKSRKTVGRKIRMLRDFGLIKLEYRRPSKGHPFKALNIMRVVFVKGITRQDAQSLSQPQKGQHSVPLANGHALDQKLSTAPPLNNPSQVGQPDSLACIYRSSHMGQVDTLQVGQIDPFTNGTPSESHRQAKALNNRDTSPEPDYTTADILKCWQQFAKGTPNEADQFIAQALHDLRIPFADIKGAICDHCLEAHEAGRPYAVRLKPAVAELLAAR